MRLPVIPTIIVAGAVAVMIALGIWQLGRMEEEQRRVASWQSLGPEEFVPYPLGEGDKSASLYRKSSISCNRVTSIAPRAGYNAAGETGWTYMAQCLTRGGEAAEIALGWSRDPNQEPVWNGGEVSGVVGRGLGEDVRLVAIPPIAGLSPNKTPEPDAEKVKMHLSYAGQWFFFALTALVIYFLALRRRSTRARGD
ncbi:SURF1 family protein [Erythrobacter gaetbuli]|uniref:SURF1-like protein n=1 Tax=Qipengyuania gaetbuli TaxID=266952 RepID=A0A844Y0N1_9SPHN|nr:SURF1 family cytochrome oxidase biogenesis protein [Qipengyuania gaetbuli]MXO51119.1 SURF1 family protein [Qipengyuania gaetbuli]